MSTKLQTLATFWQNFGLANVQKGLDEVATDITVQQDESDTQAVVFPTWMNHFHVPYRYRSIHSGHAKIPVIKKQQLCQVTLRTGSHLEDTALTTFFFSLV